VATTPREGVHRLHRSRHSRGTRSSGAQMSEQLTKRIKPDAKYEFQLIAIRRDSIVSPALCGYVVDRGDGDSLDVCLYGEGGTELTLSIQVHTDGRVTLTKSVFIGDDESVAPEILAELEGRR
jgi:hypothetical protein